MKLFFDTDILIWHLRGDERALRFLEETAKKPAAEWWTGALNHAEVVFFMRPGEESRTELFLTRFNTHPVDTDIIDAAAAMYRRWNPSHGMDINDAVLAATVEKAGGMLYTLNIKHFPVNTFLVEVPW